MFFSKKSKKEKLEKSAMKGIVSVFGDNMRSAGVDTTCFPLMKDDKNIIGSLYGFCLSVSDMREYRDKVDGMRLFLLTYTNIFEVRDPVEIETIAKDVLFDDEVNKAGENTYNYLLNIADTGLSQQEAMLFMKDDMMRDG